MVVLSASICTRGGKALVSRQYVEMTRLRVEGLLAAFPKLVGIAKQHTFVETDSVRYVYQPLENQLYLLLITTKASNIVEDLGTLRLLAKVIPDVAGNLSEVSINDFAFELIFAFDEVLSAGGYKEEVTLSTIRTNLIMDSHEEKMANMLREKKEEDAKVEMQKQAKKIKDLQMQNLKQTLMDSGNAPKQMGGMAGFGGGGPPGQSSFMDSFNGGGMGGGDGGGYDQYNAGNYGKPDSKPAQPTEPRVVHKGLQLGGGAAKKKNSLMAAMAAEDNLLPLSKKGSGGLFGLGAAVDAPVAAPSSPVTLVIEEKYTVALNREGGVESCDVKGTLTLTANTEIGSMVTVGVNRNVLLAKCTSNWTFATHPKVNKPAYEKNGTLGLKAAGKGFPMSRPVGVLRWSYSGADAAPLTINCWPEDEGTGTINVCVDFELTRPDMTLENVDIIIPLGTTDPPAIESIDGSFKHVPAEGMMCWHHDTIDANMSTGSLEFSIAGGDTNAFFPVQLNFNSESLLCPIEVTGVSAINGGAPVPKTLRKTVVPDNYMVA
mmetsp:Transcript_48491/g.71880  ORF Transcript_48491/g.71880 Transcript_48491/m.71880 type:complete len:546 (+) Transcript_48491:116-1753(+)|eukprot:CAMPEP_0195514172 /NCGR_PEP_ID=MMETSP0794_2-20130614/5631_1 /TAXON_ID=515487 /ORGANISM="Stephanopyxis turris, Strain CCMP 815" /LENGTH=545 /DNA_ID=CAMNT_0040642357 /DNA_START=115 /DNA_END=1752 /DNA_ORIENTATION=+